MGRPQPQQQHKCVRHARTHRCSLTQARGVHTYAAAAAAGKMAAQFCMCSFQKGLFLPNFLHNFLQLYFLKSQLTLENHCLTFALGFFSLFFSQHQTKSSTTFRKLSRKSSEEKLLFFPCCHFCQWPRRRRQTIRFHRRHCYGIVVPMVLQADNRRNPK